MKTRTDFKEDVMYICYKPGWKFYIGQDDDRCYLQVRCAGIDNYTGEPFEWTGRKFLLSPYMTHSEVVQTAFMAVLTAEEHETRELFTYRGQSIFDPHYDVDELAKLRASDNCLDEREN